MGTTFQVVASSHAGCRSHRLHLEHSLLLPLSFMELRFFRGSTDGGCCKWIFYGPVIFPPRYSEIFKPFLDVRPWNILIPEQRWGEMSWSPPATKPIARQRCCPSWCVCAHIYIHHHMHYLNSWTKIWKRICPMEYNSSKMFSLNAVFCSEMPRDSTCSTSSATTSTCWRKTTLASDMWTQTSRG